MAKNPPAHSLPRVRVPATRTGDATRALLASAGVHTVCQEAACPNRWECFGAHTATFLILGTICSRGCRFCNVASGSPTPVDPAEPERVADAAARLALRHVVVTSVTRDDLGDGGANQFAAVIRAVGARLPQVAIEVLTPDFEGNCVALDCVLRERPSVFNHNVETVERLTPALRSKASYLRSLAVLEHAARHAPDVAVKSGFMVGVGEKQDEVRQTLRDLRAVGCRIVTIGQYLAPSPRHYPVHEMVNEDQFAQYRAWCKELGFAAVAAGPLVRSSYHAAHAYNDMVTTETQSAQRKVRNEGNTSDC